LEGVAVNDKTFDDVQRALPPGLCLKTGLWPPGKLLVSIERREGGPNKTVFESPGNTSEHEAATKCLTFLATIAQVASDGELTLGATGEFPEGKINDTDEGELKLAVSARKGVVIMEFGKSIEWIGFGPDDVDEIILVLKKYADEARGQIH
jgi:hypothetical protein